MGSPITKSDSAIVVGGGVVGSACALALAARGFSTTVVDPVVVRRAASWGNAGHIATEQVEPLASLSTIRSFPGRLFGRGGALGLPIGDVGAWLPFSLRLLAASRPARFAAGKAALGGALGEAIGAWRRLLMAAGKPDLLLEDGHFVQWQTKEAAANGRAHWQAAETGTATFRDVTAEEVAMLLRLTNRPPAGAIRFLGTGQIADLGLLAEVLDRRLGDLGGKQLCAGVRTVQTTDRRVSLQLDTGETLSPQVVVVAAGVASGRMLRALGYKVPIIAERGYHLQSAATDWPIDLPPVVFEDRSMIATRFRSGLRLASFVEFGRPDSPPDARKWARLRQHARELGLSLPEPVSQWMGARPTLPDYLPAIGRSQAADNLFYAFGHQHLGLTLAAVTGEAIGALAAGEAPAIDLSGFDLERFQHRF
jgi:D-amino-acid dehydrogenase